MDQETPKTENDIIDDLYAQINFLDYVTEDESDAVEYLTELVQDKATIEKYIKSAYDTVVDGSVDSLDDIADIEVAAEDQVDQDEYDTLGDVKYCCDCGSEWEFASDLIEHIYEECQQEIDEKKIREFTPEGYYELLDNHVFNTDKQKDRLLRAFISFVHRNTEMLESFLEFAERRKGLIPRKVVQLKDNFVESMDNESNE